MTTIIRTKVYPATPLEVFDLLDDLAVTGMHMTEPSMPLMGGKLHLSFLSPNRTGLYTTYHWWGKLLWWTLDFTVKVTQWTRGRVKTWQTVGPAKIILYSWFEMHLEVERAMEGTIVYLSFSYEKPTGLLNRLLCILFGNWYGKWCLNQMLDDAEKQIKSVALVKKNATVWPL